MIAEDGDIGQQGTIVGGEIRFSVQAAARQPRVVESELGGISNAVSGESGLDAFALRMEIMSSRIQAFGSAQVLPKT